MRENRFIATLRGHVAAVYRVSWSSDSRMLVSASKDSTLKVSLSLSHIPIPYSHSDVVVESQDAQDPSRPSGSYG